MRNREDDPGISCGSMWVTDRGWEERYLQDNTPKGEEK